MIAIGGWNEGSTKYSGMAKDKKKRQKFVNSTIDFLQKHNFDSELRHNFIGSEMPTQDASMQSFILYFPPGLDLDWEYPAKRGGSPQDKKNFILLVKELKEVYPRDPKEMPLQHLQRLSSTKLLAGFRPPQVLAHSSHRCWKGHDRHVSYIYCLRL